MSSKFYSILPILICGLAMPLSLFMWLGNVAFHKLTSNDDSDDNTIPPTRWLFSILVPILLMLYGLKKGSVNKSGAILGLIISIILSVANHAFLISLATFFFTSSKATKYGNHLKKKFESDYKEGEIEQGHSISNQPASAPMVTDCSKRILCFFFKLF
jgi:sorbitol-specific phosphotransferase system component IIC